MLKRSLFLLTIFASAQCMGWGVTGHRTVGLIGQNHLSKKAEKAITRILNGASLADVSNWMDDIKSNDKYDYAQDWHWVTIEDGQTYAEAEKNPDGDIIATIQRLIDELEIGGLSAETERENLMMLVHLVGDIHQPLHVGNGSDQGGNSIKVKWFYQNSNLHRVWDSEMIDDSKYSYTELAGRIERMQGTLMVDNLQQASVLDWAAESMALRPQVYETGDVERMGYAYRYHNFSTIELRLFQGGVRLAGVLNGIYK